MYSLSACLINLNIYMFNQHICVVSIVIFLLRKLYNNVFMKLVAINVPIVCPLLIFLITGMNHRRRGGRKCIRGDAQSLGQEYP